MPPYYRCVFTLAEGDAQFILDSSGTVFGALFDLAAMGVLRDRSASLTMTGMRAQFSGLFH
jgi:hypothetical protein